jgi:putative transposase
MPRPHRIQVADGVFHVWSRGNRREPIVIDDRDRHRFLELLADIVQRFDWLCLAYCVLDNHFHLLVETPKPNLADGMQRLKGTHGRWFNDKYGLVGHVFQGRYGSEHITTERYRLEVARYILLNPVRAGVARLPEEYRWSSYAATVGQAPLPRFLAVDRLLEPYGKGWVARARFRAFVEDGLVGEQSEADVSRGLTPDVIVAAGWAGSAVAV